MDGAWSVEDATIYKSMEHQSKVFQVIDDLELVTRYNLLFRGSRAIAQPPCQWMISCVTLFSMEENFLFQKSCSNDACTERKDKRLCLVNTKWRMNEKLKKESLDGKVM
jgi:hypothetical protein